MNEKKAFIIRLPLNLFVRLKKQAHDLDVSRNKIIIDLLDKNLPKKEKISLKSKNKVIS